MTLASAPAAGFTVAAARAAGGELLVRSPARLHFGLINGSGAFGRVDGGLGVGLAAPWWQLRVGLGIQTTIDSRLRPELALAARATVEHLCEALGLPPLVVAVEAAVPVHAGLGSKTALLMAIGRAATVLAGRSLSVLELAALVGRGGTSGVGVHVAEAGGLVVDAGRRYPSEKAEFGPSSASVCRPPALVCRLEGTGMSVVHLRYERRGPNGASERAVFAAACPAPRSETVEAAASVFSQILPAFVDGDLDGLNEGLGELQGRGLKRHEWAHQSSRTLAFRRHLRRAVPGRTVGLSSMGPTMFVITDDVAPVLAAISSFEAEPVHVTVTGVATEGTVVNPWKATSS